MQYPCARIDTRCDIKVPEAKEKIISDSQVEWNGSTVIPPRLADEQERNRHCGSLQNHKMWRTRCANQWIEWESFYHGALWGYKGGFGPSRSTGWHRGLMAVLPAHHPSADHLKLREADRWRFHLHHGARKGLADTAAYRMPAIDPPSGGCGSGHHHQRDRLRRGAFTCVWMTWRAIVQAPLWTNHRRARSCHQTGDPGRT